MLMHIYLKHHCSLNTANYMCNAPSVVYHNMYELTSCSSVIRQYMQRQILDLHWYVTRGKCRISLFFFGCYFRALEFKPCQFSLPSAEVVNDSACSHLGLVRPDGQITLRNFLEIRLFHIDPVYAFTI